MDLRSGLEIWTYRADLRSGLIHQTKQYIYEEMELFCRIVNGRAALFLCY